LGPSSENSDGVNCIRIHHITFFHPFSVPYTRVLKVGHDLHP